jgi:hypothetical protein
LEDGRGAHFGRSNEVTKPKKELQEVIEWDDTYQWIKE